jgi:hypothetical protein
MSKELLKTARDVLVPLLAHPEAPVVNTVRVAIAELDAAIAAAAQAPTVQQEPADPAFRNMPNPSEADLSDPVFEAIWQATKTWDVNAPEHYSGYCGMNGSHVMLILNAVRAAWQAARAAPPPQTADAQPVAGQYLWRVFNLGWPRGHENGTNAWGNWQLITKADFARLLADDEHGVYEFVPYVPAAAQPPASQDENARDAARYRKLRRWDSRREWALYISNGSNPLYEEHLDAACDSAIAASNGA